MRCDTNSERTLNTVSTVAYLFDSIQEPIIINIRAELLTALKYILYTANTESPFIIYTVHNVSLSSTAAAASSSSAAITSLSSTAAAAPSKAIPDDAQALARSELATLAIQVKVDDHFIVDKDTCLAKCIHCKRTHRVNKTTKTNLTKHVQDKHPTKLVVSLHDSQRRPGGEEHRVLQLLGVNIKDKFEAGLLEFLLLTDQPFDLIESESFRNWVKVLNTRVNIYSTTTLTRRIKAAFKKYGRK